MNANNVVVPGGKRGTALPSGNPHGGGMSKCATKQQEYRRMFHRDGWGRGTQLLNLLLPRSAPTRTYNGAGVQALGSLSASFPWIHLKCYSCEGLKGQMPPHVAARGLTYSYW